MPMSGSIILRAAAQFEEHRDTVNLIIVLPLWEGEHLEDKAGQPLALHWQMNEASFDHG